MRLPILARSAVLFCFSLTVPAISAQVATSGTRDFSVEVIKDYLDLQVEATIKQQETDAIPASDAQKLVEYWKSSSLAVASVVGPKNSARVTVQAAPTVSAKDAPSVVSRFQPQLSDNLRSKLPDLAVTQSYDLDISIKPVQLSALIHDCVTVTLYGVDGNGMSLTGTEVMDQNASDAAKHPVCKAIDGGQQMGRLRYDDAPIAMLVIDGRPNHKTTEVDCAYASVSTGLPVFRDTCQTQFLLARDESKRDHLVVGMDVGGSRDYPRLLVEESLFDDSTSSYYVNGIKVSKGTSLSALDATWAIDWQKKPDGCRAFSDNEGATASLILKAYVPVQTQRTNGILVGSAKVFDVASLQRMLNTTASQLAALSGFNASSISSAYGNLQGITRDTSYLNAQLTTAPTASINQQATVGTTSPNTTQTTTPIGSTTVTLQCPDGSLPTIGTGTTLGGCATVPITGTTANVPAYAPVTNNGPGFQGALTTTPAGSTVTSTGSTANSQNQTTTATPSVSGVVPSAVAANALAAPNNIGVSSADILAEQVQLNSQITTLRLLLQGALSDEYLLKNSRAVGARQQTTLGFTVALDPPRQFKHAVAEIEVIIVPTDRSAGPSIMNLLPSEKTYNVAKVTSNQKAFGAGAVIEPVSFGVSTGKSKDRLYLAKDTDTLALQYPLPVVSGHRDSIPTPLPQKIHDVVKSAVGFQKIGGCAWDTSYSIINGSLQSKMENDVTEAMVRGTQPIAFGWQFRPVLGADYVQGGERQVFAQLALGAGLSQNYVPHVYIETVWRDYDQKNQVVGAVYEGSCSLVEQVGGVNVLSQPMVRDVSVSDLGGGQLKLKATGNFYSSSLAVQSGQSTLSSIFFDGATLEVFGNAHDLIEGGDLKIIGQNGQNSPFGIPTDHHAIQDQTCGISNATMRAVPRPDGNSRVSLDLTLGSRFKTAADKDGEPNPLVMINGQVYGLRESPFVNSGARCTKSSPATCHYEFLAPTSNVRNGQIFLVRDLAWDKMQFVGTTQFLPSFTAATTLGTTASTSPTNEQRIDAFPTPATSGGASSPPPKGRSSANIGATGNASDAGNDMGSKSTYEISGYDFASIANPCSNGDKSSNSALACLRIYADSDSTLLPFKVVSDNLLILEGVKAGAKSLRFQVFWSVNDKSPSPAAITEWDLTVPKTTDDTKNAIVGSPAFLYVGDSQTISFSSPAFSSFATSTSPVVVTFDGNQVSGAKYDAKKKALTVPITTTMTKIPGHKELTVTVPAPQGSGTPQATTLSFDVVRQVIKE